MGMKKPSGKKARQKARRKVVRRLYGCLVGISAFIVAGFCFYKLMVQPPQLAQAANGPGANAETLGAGGGGSQPADQERKRNFYTFLIYGMDDGNGNTDTIMVGAYDTENQVLNMVSIPRDTLIETSRSNKRINAVYSNEGTEGLEAEVSDLLGIPIDFYVQVNLKAFQKIVDAVGGVDYNVPVDMDYEDPTQDLYIHLNAGMQHLTGAKALQLVRCRNVYATQDIGRVSTQQGFLKALARQTLQFGNITKVKQFAGIFNQYLKTDLKLENMIWFGEKLLGLSSDQLNLQTIPYNDTTASYKGGHYVSLDIDEVLNMVNEKFNPYTKDRERSDLTIISIVDGEAVFS